MKDDILYSPIRTDHIPISQYDNTSINVVNALGDISKKRAMITGDSVVIKLHQLDGEIVEYSFLITNVARLGDDR